MTDAKHTPGPWIASKFGCQVLTGDSWNSICELKGDARWKDRRGVYDQDYQWQVQEANAHLIAAAPDMYEALKKLEYWFDTDPEILDAMSSDDRENHERQHTMIRAALARAKGEAA